MSTAEQAAERESRSIVAAQPAVTTRPLVHRWYLGGLASATAAACTHPLDLLKVTSSHHLFASELSCSASLRCKV